MDKVVTLALQELIKNFLGSLGLQYCNITTKMDLSCLPEPFSETSSKLKIHSLSSPNSPIARHVSLNVENFLFGAGREKNSSEFYKVYNNAQLKVAQSSELGV